VSTEIIVSVGRLVVVTGPPGAGKSTVAGILTNRARRSVLVDGDAFFGFLTSGAIQPWLREANDQNEVVRQLRRFSPTTQGQTVREECLEALAHVAGGDAAV
jgi:adenylate kinase family enzyme